jgi:hypothetical protein
LAITVFDHDLRPSADARSTDWAAGLRRRILGISPEEVLFERRGFHAPSARIRERLEQVGLHFLHGYHSALEQPEALALALRLGDVERERRGFAFEGAAMALYLLDSLTPWRRDRFEAFLAGPGDAHAYMLHVGAGWVLARLRRSVDAALARMDPLLRWLAVDGIGFHETFFHPQRTLDRQEVPRRLSGYARRAFDQGVGRCLWFAEGADVDGIVERIEAFDGPRRADLWSGVGLACAYAGGLEPSDVRELASCAGPHRPPLAQGAAFAAKARERADNAAAHTEQACRILCGLSAAEAAALTDDMLADLPDGGAEPAFEVWRRRLAEQFARE